MAETGLDGSEVERRGSIPGEDAVGSRFGKGDSIAHGGRLREAARLFPGAPRPLLDLSTGINPHAYPVPPLGPDAWRRLPDPEDERALRDAAARFYGVPGGDYVAAAPGSQLLISLLPSLLPSRRAVVLTPTYGEHAAAWRGAGVPVEEVPDADALAERAEPGTILTLCEPNNPDGRRLGAGAVARLAATATGRGAILVVDEAFGDLESDVVSASSPLLQPGVCVLRSFGKCFGLAGMRLGFLVATADLVRRAQRLLGPWAVSGPAIAIGLAALADREWIVATAARLDGDARRMDGLLRRHGLSVVGGTRLFRLAAASDAWGRWERLGRAGIVVRRFPDRPHWLRFGLPGRDEEWIRLEAALADG